MRDASTRSGNGCGSISPIGRSEEIRNRRHFTEDATTRSVPGRSPSSEKALADPLNLLSVPMSDDGFNKLQERFKQFSNGIAADLHDMEVAALDSRFPLRKDPTDRYGYVYPGLLPFDDAVVDIWGNGPSLHFASNADFRGNHGALSRSSVYDVIRCTEMRPDPAPMAPGAAMEAWLAGKGRGDLTLDGSALVAVRGAKMANVPVKNWFDADKLSDDQLAPQSAMAGTIIFRLAGCRR